MIRKFIDQLGDAVDVEFPPKRIISLVPSQTELFFDLGLINEVVGVTKFCERPREWVRSKMKIGGTKTINFESIDSLHPDLIIGNKEENEREAIEGLRQRYPVWMSDVVSLEDALGMILSVGEICDKADSSKIIANQIKDGFGKIERKRGSVLYLIWNKPWMAAGRNTFIDSMLTTIGYANVLSTERYPELTIEQIQKLDPELIFLSSEPFPFKDEHISEIEKHLPHANVRLVDGQFFSWYGSRLLKAPDYFNRL